MSDPLLVTIQPGKYRHTKSGQLYEVLGTALHTESEDLLVAYRPLYDSNYGIFVRPYQMFISNIELNGKVRPRFEKIDD